MVTESSFQKYKHGVSASLFGRANKLSLDYRQSVCRTAAGILVVFFFFLHPVRAIAATDLLLGTTGIGVASTHKLAHDNDFRLTVSTLQFQIKTDTTNSVPFALSANTPVTPVIANLAFHDRVTFLTAGAILDHHFKRTSFFAAGGLMFNLDRIDAVSDPGQSNVVFQNTVLPGTVFGSIDVHVRWNLLDPYIGLGWQPANRKVDNNQREPRIEMGFYDEGPPHPTLIAHGVVAANSAIFGPTLNALNEYLGKDLAPIRLFPVIRISLPLGHK